MNDKDPTNTTPSPDSADSRIIELLFSHSEEGLALLRRKYGALCRRIALNLLGDPRDAEECESDVCLAVWNTIPPTRPESLSAYVGRITRNIAVSTLRKRTAKGRKCEGTVLIDELAECLPDTSTPDPADDLTLREALQNFFDGLSDEDRAIMLRRYYDGEPTESIARELGLRHGTLRVRLHRLRERLREHLESAGISL